MLIGTSSDGMGFQKTGFGSGLREISRMKLKNFQQNTILKIMLFRLILATYSICHSSLIPVVPNWLKNIYTPSLKSSVSLPFFLPQPPLATFENLVVRTDNVD